MELSVSLTKEQWEYILEVINLNDTTHIKGAAITMLKSKLDQSFESLKDETKPIT